MGRQALGKIELTVEQLKWAQDAVSRRGKVLDRLKSERERHIVKALRDKLEALPNPDESTIVLKASRAEARFLQRIAQALSDALATRYLPEYSSRGLNEYVIYTAKKIETLNDLVKKVERVL